MVLRSYPIPMDSLLGPKIVKCTVVAASGWRRRRMKNRNIWINGGMRFPGRICYVNREWYILYRKYYKIWSSSPFKLVGMEEMNRKIPFVCICLPTKTVLTKVFVSWYLCCALLVFVKKVFFCCFTWILHNYVFYSLIILLLLYAFYNRSLNRLIIHSFLQVTVFIFLKLN